MYIPATIFIAKNDASPAGKRSFWFFHLATRLLQASCPVDVGRARARAEASQHDRKRDKTKIT